jgi:hypothetical protein
MEEDDVIGITNYVDVGLHLAMPLGAADGAAGAGAGAGGQQHGGRQQEEQGDSPVLHLGAQWQVGGAVLAALLYQPVCKHKPCCFLGPSLPAWQDGDQ